MLSSLLRRIHCYACGASCGALIRRCLGTSAECTEHEKVTTEHPLVDCSRLAEGDLCHVTLVDQFITQEEEDRLMGEVAKSLRRSRYQYEHWDGVRVRQAPRHTRSTNCSCHINLHLQWVHTPALTVKKNMLLLAA